MRILIDIGHPAHVHYFKNLARHFINSGSEVLFTCREKEFEIELLKHYGFKFRSFGKKYKSIIGKMLGMIKFDAREFLVGLKFKPDLLLSAGSIYAAHASFFLNKPHISLEDTGNMEQVRLYLPFTSAVLTPSYLKQDLGKKTVKFKGINELTYLHPNYYDDKANSIPADLKEPYSILRFVSWGASHDRGQQGMSIDVKNSIVRLLASKTNVYISSESPLPDEFRQYKMNIKPEEMHDALAGAELFIGEGATMAAECGVLGTPAFYINSLAGCNNDELEKYGLVFNFRSENGLLKEIENLLELQRTKEYYRQAKNRFIQDNIDVTAFLIWFVENYPKSLDVMKKNPDFQLTFK